MGSTWCPRCSNCFDCGDCLWHTWNQWMIIAMSWNVEQMMHMRTNEQNVVYNTTCNEGGRFKCVKKLLWNPFKQLATKVGESNEVWTGTGWETHSSAKVRHINQLFSSNQPSLVTSTCNPFRSQQPSWWHQSKVQPQINIFWWATNCQAQMNLFCQKTKCEQNETSGDLARGWKGAGCEVHSWELKDQPQRCDPEDCEGPL